MHPVLFHIAGRPISSFSVATTLACLLAAWIAGCAYRQMGIAARYAWRAYPVVLIAGLVGARACLALERALLDQHVSFIHELLTNRGSTFHGGLLAGIAALLTKGAIDKIPVGKSTAAWAPAVAVGLAVGRIGCFLNGDDYGVPTDLFSGIAFPQGTPPTSLRVHPAQLYESLWALAMAIVLWRRIGKSRALFAEFLVLEGSGRFLIEIVRTNPPAVWLLSTAQIVAAAGVLVGLAVLWISTVPRHDPQFIHKQGGDNGDTVECFLDCSRDGLGNQHHLRLLKDMSEGPSQR